MIACRTMLLTSCIFGYLLFAVYPAVLTSYMSISNMDHPVKEVSDVLKFDYKVLVHEKSASHSLLQKAPKGNL